MTNANWFNEKVRPKNLPEKIEIFDTTLRDGEQTPGVSLTADKKLEIARALSDLGVDIIEAGFPIASDGDFKAVKQISKEVSDAKTKICGLARCVKKDMDACINADVDLIHIFIGTSKIHRDYKLKMTKEEILKSAGESIQYCIDHGFRVHFSPEDACRTELDYLLKVCKLAESCGVDYINIPDTVGVMTPAAMRYLIDELNKNLNVKLAVHCHNDFGMAVSNTLAGIEGGATVPHLTINGLGERAGNADLEQVVVACKLLYEIKTNITTEKIYKTSKLVERLTGIRVMPNFPIVGENAFAHESGVHVHGVLARAETYESITPELVGATRKLVIGKLVGIHGVSQKLEELGIDVTKEQVQRITKKVKDLGDMGKKVVEEDLIAIAEDIIGKVSERLAIVKLIDLREHIDLNRKPFAFVSLVYRGKEVVSASDGVGPVDASLNAIRKAIGEEKIVLEEYHLDAITGGSDALADVTIRVGNGEKTVMAQGVHEDVVMASVIAFINGLNRILVK
ncbi:MAG: 2-isopropylmalate synthase [Candidatus Altiarchaeales archaeon HGW-Altiarchaeales-3]|nr:MAG: 2-isopropylmalate synthase [Candidatus Altiarchaeales archaeon HGW-Altiarchaeales-3]